MTDFQCSSSTAPADLVNDLASLRTDCARMVPHWAPPEKDPGRPVPPTAILGVRVPADSARLVAGMAEFGA